jgi:hypothetical protein
MKLRDTQRRIFSLCHADGLILVGNTSNAIHLKLIFSAVQTELTLSVSKKAKAKVAKDMTTVLEQWSAETTTLVKVSSRPPMDVSSTQPSKFRILSSSHI